MQCDSISFDLIRDLVLQCSSCKTIIGDTCEFTCSATVKGTELIALKAATDVTVDRIAHTESFNAGDAATYFHVCCSGCGGVLGRMYTQVPPALHALHSVFSFDVMKCTSYRLGSADIRVAGQGGDRGEGGSKPSSSDDRSMEEVCAKLEALEVEMLKMQGMILLHDTQLQTLPGYPSQIDGPPRIDRPR